MTTEPIDYSAKLCAGNLAIDDERGMERGEGNHNDYSNEAEGEFSDEEEEKKTIEGFKDIEGDIDARVKVTKKRRSVSVRHLP